MSFASPEALADEACHTSFLRLSVPACNPYIPRNPIYIYICIAITFNPCRQNLLSCPV